MLRERKTSVKIRVFRCQIIVGISVVPTVGRHKGRPMQENHTPPQLMKIDAMPWHQWMGIVASVY